MVLLHTRESLSTNSSDWLRETPAKAGNQFLWKSTSLTMLIFVLISDYCVESVHVIIVYTLLLGCNLHMVIANAHLMFLPSSVHPWISCWGGCGAPKDLLQTRKPKWSVFSKCTVSHLETTQCERSSFSISVCLSFFQHQNQKFGKRIVRNPDVLMKD